VLRIEERMTSDHHRGIGVGGLAELHSDVASRASAQAHRYLTLQRTEKLRGMLRLRYLEEKDQGDREVLRSESARRHRPSRGHPAT
jgi:hypothetical protein